MLVIVDCRVVCLVFDWLLDLRSGRPKYSICLEQPVYLIWPRRRPNDCREKIKLLTLQVWRETKGRGDEKLGGGTGTHM